MRRAAHNGCCRRVAQVRALCSTLWKLLASEQLIDVLVNIEIPLVNVLADMELCGIGVNMERCIQARNVLGKKLRCLKKEAYKLVDMAFSLYTAADIANVLFGYLKLPVPEGNKGKRHPSTDKHCLDLLRNEHPIIPVIKEHRTLAKLLNCTLGSICSLARLSVIAQKYTLHGHWLQTSTATGRLSMEEPNLQCVEHKVDFKMTKDKNGGDADHYTINARDFLVPTQLCGDTKGTKAFLSKIKFGNSKEKSKAQKQAVNSICQGSAADIIKIAMINIYSVIVEGVDQPDSCSSHVTKFHMLKGHCRILLQVHDELVLEVDPSVLKEAALLLQQSMEGAELLLVPLHAKLKSGRTWGSLEPYDPVDVTVHGA